MTVAFDPSLPVFYRRQESSGQRHLHAGGAWRGLIKCLPYFHTILITLMFSIQLPDPYLYSRQFPLPQRFDLLTHINAVDVGAESRATAIALLAYDHRESRNLSSLALTDRNFIVLNLDIEVNSRTCK